MGPRRRGEKERDKALTQRNNSEPLGKGDLVLSGQYLFFFLSQMTRQHWIAFSTVAATFMYHSIFRSYASQTNSVSSNKENPLAISCSMNLFSSSVTSSPCLSSSLLWASKSIFSPCSTQLFSLLFPSLSQCFLAVPTTLTLILPLFPRLEIKKLFCHALYSNLQ